MSGLCFAEYVWLDGAEPTQKIRAKTRILQPLTEPKIEDFPQWSFDGSSTNQASGDASDCGLQPVYFCEDPIRGPGNFLVLCEVNSSDGNPHASNTRARLRSAMDEVGTAADCYIGFEQEYTLFMGDRPLDWPEGGFPPPQGPFYCGVGAENVNGRELIEAHMMACVEAGINIYGVNAEVMPSQWEFQIGYRGFNGEPADPLTMSDHLILARYLLCRIGEEQNIIVRFDNKPIKGDWNGAGMHTNFSTKKMREKSTGKAAIDSAITNLEKKHKEHIEDYGVNLHERLTGDHETCSIDQFRYGVSDRGASIRIPPATHEKGYGYIEDRRPGANADPYTVAWRLIGTICNG